MKAQAIARPSPTRRMFAAGYRPPAQPMPCGECHGAGHVTVRTCNHSGACPCDGIEIPCGSCNGLGSVRCECCGERPGTTTTVLGLYCGQCARETEAEMTMERR